MYLSKNHLERMKKMKMVSLEYFICKKNIVSYHLKQKRNCYIEENECIKIIDVRVMLTFFTKIVNYKFKTSFELVKRLARSIPESCPLSFVI